MHTHPHILIEDFFNKQSVMKKLFDRTCL